MATNQTALEDRFNNLWTAIPETSCWWWIGTSDSNGYGRIRIEGKWVRAHRTSWEIYNGEIPPDNSYHGTCVLHHCDNPGCVRPDHLFLGTQTDNVTDMINKGRRRSDSIMPSGENHHQGKLSWDKVDEIRADKRVQSLIAADYGVSQAMVSRIKTNSNWRKANVN